jgi:peptide chain release factor
METKTIQLTSGRGPQECEWVAAETLAFLLKKADEAQISVEILDKQEGRTSGDLLSVSIKLKGKKVNMFIQPWLGSIQWIGQSPYRKNHKRKNWFIGAFEISHKVSVPFNEKDVTFQTMRSSGAGGQHVNKVSSAVRAIHTPTGLKALSMDSRSQLQNKKLALLSLKEKLSALNDKQVNQLTLDKWNNHLELQRGNPVKTFYGEKFKLKK